MNDTTILSVSNALQWVRDNTSDTAVFRGQSKAEWQLESRIARLRVGTHSEQRLFREFCRLSRPYIRTNPRDDLEWLAIAQHHGLGTRLLDWTTSPLVALWFSVRNYSENETDARLWAFFPDDNLTSQSDVSHVSIDPFQQPTPLLIRPPQISDRIVAQSGCFVLHPYDPVKNDFIPLQQLDSLVESVVIPRSCMPAIVAELDRCGINEMSMFPGLDSLAGYLTLKVGH